MRTVSNEPRSTMSQPETVSPSRTSWASAAAGEDPGPVPGGDAGAGRRTGRMPGPARTSSEPIGAAVEPTSASAA